MNRSDSSLAPAPMASMPITEPTPKTIPERREQRARLLRAKIGERL